MKTPVEEDPEHSKRRVAENLLSLLGCDYLVNLRISSENPKKEFDRIVQVLERGLEGKAERCYENWFGNSEIQLGFRSLSEDICPNKNIILGPLAEHHKESKEFRKFWGEDCKMRRFLDGTVKESIEIPNPSGPAYFVVSIIHHLKTVHFPKTRILSKFFDLSSFIPSEEQRAESLKTFREAYLELSRLLTDQVSTESLPVRRIRCASSLLHYGGDLDPYRSRRPRRDCESLWKNNKIGCYTFNRDSTSNALPLHEMASSIHVIIDITSKRSMSAELFSKLRLAYLIDLRRRLLTKNPDLGCVIKGKDLILDFKGFFWRIDVESPCKGISSANENMTGSITEFFQGMSLRHNNWSSTAWVTRKWLSSKFLEDVVSETTLDIILAHIFMNPQLSYKAPYTSEAALLRFFDFLSFTDFKKIPLVLNHENYLSDSSLANFSKKFSQERHSLPPLCSLTPFDHPNNFSSHTASLKEVDLRRLVNMSRKTLHSLLTGKSVELSNFIHSCNKADRNYDVIIHIMPSMVRSSNKSFKASKTKENKEDHKLIPIIDFNPLECYLERIKESYGDIARFYHSRAFPHFIGVKINKEESGKSTQSVMKSLGKRKVDQMTLVPNMNAFIEDLKILGTGFVENVECKTLL